MRIFLAVPFSSRVDADGNVMGDYRKSIEKLLGGLRQRGHTVYCALEYTKWRMDGLSLPEEELGQDFTEIDAADKLIVVLEEQLSAGVQLESGYAYARQKVIEVYQIGKPAWSNIAFSRLNGNDIISVQSIDDFVGQVLERN